MPFLFTFCHYFPFLRQRARRAGSIARGMRALFCEWHKKNARVQYKFMWIYKCGKNTYAKNIIVHNIRVCAKSKRERAAQRRRLQKKSLSSSHSHTHTQLYTEFAVLVTHTYTSHGSFFRKFFWVRTRIEMLLPTLLSVLTLNLWSVYVAERVSPEFWKYCVCVFPCFFLSRAVL